MTYDRQTWVNIEDAQTTPTNAARFNYMEAGIAEAHAALGMLLSGSRLHHFGHSLAAGGGASGPDRDCITRLAAALKTREVQSSKGGAILHWNNVDPDVAGNGGWHTLCQQTRATKRSSGLVRTATIVGATAVPVGAATDVAWGAGQLVNIGTGTNAEVAYVVTVSGTSPTQTLNLDRALANAHAINDPVFAVPHAYEAANPLYLMWYGLNDIMASGTGSGGVAAVDSGHREGEGAFKEAFRGSLAKLLTAEYFDGNHSIAQRSTAGAAATAFNATQGFGVGSWVRPMTAVGQHITIDLPANFTGEDFYMWFVSPSLQGGDLDFTVDGVAHNPSLSARNAHGPTSKWNVFVKPFRDLTPGRHTIVATQSYASVSLLYYSGCGIGAAVPPIVLCPSFNRPWDYDVWPNWTYGNARGTVNANHGIGLSSFTITAPISPAGGAATLRKGELITLDYGGANEETLEIAADATGTTVTTTTASTKAHNTGGAYQGNAHDNAILQRCMNWIPSMLAEGFPNTCLYVDVEAALNKQERYFVGSNTVGLTDGAHYSDAGHAVVAEAILDKLRTTDVVGETLSAHVSVPIAPLPDPVYFVAPVTPVAGTAPGTTNVVAEAFANSRHRRDLRRATEARLQLVITTNALAGRRGRVEYSLDNGTTWKTLGKKVIWSDTLIQTASEPGQVELNPTGATTGPRDSGWFPLPSEVWSVTDVLLRYTHGNSSTTNPTYQFVSAEFR